MDVLNEIMAQRRADVDAAKRLVPPARLRKEAEQRTHHSLPGSLAAGTGTRIIAEVKKASPSAGLLQADYRPAETARIYEESGACAISVLTEPRHFQGCEQHLREVRAAVRLPLLRKDFVCDPYQILEAAAWGADVVLLIVAALGPGELTALHRCARDCGLDVLVEAHTAGELDAALSLPDAIVGVNSRNLKTLKTDLGIARDLSARIPAGRMAIAESGIRTREDIEALERAGYRGFLIGETLMRDRDPAGKMRELMGRRCAGARR
jgi:indole-3-glycerol phosphate synthase